MSAFTDDDEDERECEKDGQDNDLQRQSGDAEAAIDGVGPQRRKTPSRSSRRKIPCPI
jgi:hypothetical protein